ncbi:MAG: efflux RND transporter periplasmic adaptor subunit [Saprospiraceae bacterium]|nr:efflux RND transporter periplasmic adaptor subunit [Saprospiraceae bacterium]
MKKQLSLSVLVLLTLWACNQPEEESPSIDLAAPVSVIDVTTSSLSRHTIATGNALAEKEMEVTSQIAGKYKLKNHPAYNRPFKLGDRVKAGQAFVEIEDKEYVNGISLESKKMNLDLAKQEYEKQKSVYDKGGVTLRELRNAELQMTNAQNELENAQIRLEKMKIDIPISGTIVTLPHYTPNSQIQQGNSLATIMNYSKMYVDVSLPENTMTEIKTGQKVQITNYSLPNDTLIGTVTELSPAIDINTRTYLGKVRFGNPKLLIRPGMFIKTLIKVNQKDDIIVIPKEVIISDQRGKRVFVVKENTAFERIIETGIENEDRIEVVSGLEVNERLVIKGFETLRNKSKVKVLK